MDATELKAVLLQLLRDDPEFRAAVQEVVEEDHPFAALRADAPEPEPAPEPVGDLPAWLAKKTGAHGPHTKARFGGKTP